MRAVRIAVLILAFISLSSSIQVRATEDSGSTEGMLTSKGEYFLMVKPESQEALKFVPYWRGGLPRDGGGFDKDTLQSIKDVKSGSKVRVSWKQDDFKRIVKVEVLEQPKPPVLMAQHKDGEDGPDVHGKSTTGTTIGSFVDRHPRRIVVKNENGVNESFFFPMVDGAPDKEITRHLTEIKAGEKLKIEWQTHSDGKFFITKLYRAE